jgi:DNA-binding transcriptional MerR regulator
VDRSVDVPEKLFFKIGEVSRLLEVDTHVLRYWEREFSAVRPRKSRGGQRVYRRVDVEVLVHIKRLLRDEGFTIAGARRRLAAERAESSAAATAADEQDPVVRVEVLERELARVRGERDDANRAFLDAATRLARTEAAINILRQALGEIATMVDGRAVADRGAR